MSTLQKISFYQNRRDEVPNQELARELAVSKDVNGIREIAENLWNKEPNIQSDCLKVLYETGYLAPELIAPYVDDFLKLIVSRNNRLVWGAMIALGTCADLKAGEIFSQVETIQKVMAKGSVITIDNGIKTLALVACANDEYNRKLFPFLLDHLKTCRQKEVPQHSEKILVAVIPTNKQLFIETIQKRMGEATDLQKTRLKKVIKKAEER